MAHMFDTTSSLNQSYNGWNAGVPRARPAPGLLNALRRQGRRRIPVRHIMLFLLAIVSFKVFLFFDLGGAAYGAKIEALSKGTTLEQIAARAMVLDPVSEWLVNGIRFGAW